MGIVFRKGEKLPAIILLAATIASMLSSNANAQDACHDILKWGLFETNESSSHQSRLDLVNRLICESSSSGMGASLDLLAKLNIPVAELPIPVPVDLSGGAKAWERSVRNYCDTRLDSHVNTSSFRQKIVSASQAISRAWQNCMNTRRADTAVASLVMINEKVFQIEVRYDPPGFNLADLLNYQGIQFTFPNGANNSERCDVTPKIGPIVTSKSVWQCAFTKATLDSTPFTITYSNHSPINGHIPPTADPPVVTEECKKADMRSCIHYRFDLGGTTLNGHGKSFRNFTGVFVPKAKVTATLSGIAHIAGEKRSSLEGEFRWARDNSRSSKLYRTEAPFNGGTIPISASITELIADDDGIVTVDLSTECRDIVGLAKQEVSCIFSGGTYIQLDQIWAPPPN